MNPIEEFVAILKAQQMADGVVIKCLLHHAALGIPLTEAWAAESSNAIVDEQLYSQTNAYAKLALEEFHNRLNFWGDAMRELSRRAE